jgi:hypothetical protein
MRETMLKQAIKKLYLYGEWCLYLGKNNYHEFKRSCGEKYYLSDQQLENVLSDLIYS